MTLYVNLSELEENKRIELMVHRVMVHGERVGFIVETEEKADRYIRKMKERAPGIVVTDRRKIEKPGRLAGVFVKIERGLDPN